MRNIRDHETAKIQRLQTLKGTQGHSVNRVIMSLFSPYAVNHS